MAGQCLFGVAFGFARDIRHFILNFLKAFPGMIARLEKAGDIQWVIGKYPC